MDTAGAFFIVLGAVLTAGGVLAMIALSLVPVLSAEQYARRQLAGTLELHRQVQQGPPVAKLRSKHPGSHWM